MFSLDELRCPEERKGSDGRKMNLIKIILLVKIWPPPLPLDATLTNAGLNQMLVSPESPMANTEVRGPATTSPSEHITAFGCHYRR